MLEPFQEQGWRDKGEWWRGYIYGMINLIYFKNFCKCHNIPPPSTTIKKFLSTKQTETMNLIYITLVTNPHRKKNNYFNLALK
jgi:hypothetical protein